MKSTTLSMALCLLLSSGFAIAQSDSTQSKKTKLAVYPALGSSPETGFMYGVIAFMVIKHQDDKQAGFYRPTSISPYFVYTQKKQILSTVDLDVYTKTGINVNAKLRYFNFPDFYYGIGNAANPDIKEQYTDRFFRLDGRIMKAVQSDVFVGLLYDLQHNDIREAAADAMLSNSDVRGADGGANMGIGPGMLKDSRNSTLYPTAGSYLNAGITFYHKVLGGENNYIAYLLDYRKYLKLLGDKNVLALQLRAGFTSGSEVPFYKLPKLGGDDRLRGLAHKNLYIDRQSYYLQAELRQDLFWRFGGVLFAGMGEATASIGDFGFKHNRFVFGAGARFQALKDEKMNVRLDIGFTDNGQSAFYLSVREAF